MLTIDHQPLSWKQIVHYLQRSDKLASYINELVEQYVLDRALEQNPVTIDAAAIEQHLADWRQDHHLHQPDRFAEWLASNGLDEREWRQQTVFHFKVAKLKAQICQPRLQDYFIERKLYLDRVVLSRIAVNDRELAEELYQQIQEGTSFEQLARNYSIAPEHVANGMMGAVSRGMIPDAVRSLLDVTREGDISAPLNLDDHWHLFRVEQFIPAALDDPQVQTLLQDELFEAWLMEKMQAIEVEVSKS